MRLTINIGPVVSPRTVREGLVYYRVASSIYIVVIAIIDNDKPRKPHRALCIRLNREFEVVGFSEYSVNTLILNKPVGICKHLTAGLSFETRGA